MSKADMSRRGGVLMMTETIRQLSREQRAEFVAEIEESSEMADLRAETQTLILNAEKELLANGWHWDGTRMINGPVEPSGSKAIQAGPGGRKSSNHAKITGDFAEALVLYWLSKDGFECARVDHTGIDLIATNPYTQEIMGISVKGRSRDERRKNAYLRIDRNDFVKVEAACHEFGCTPYFAIVVDMDGTIRCFILSMEHLLSLFPLTRTECGWKMDPKRLAQYDADPAIMQFCLTGETKRWWSES